MNPSSKIDVQAPRPFLPSTLAKESSSSQVARNIPSESTISSGAGKAKESNCLWSIIFFPYNITKKLLGIIISLITCGKFCAEKPTPEQVKKELKQVQNKEQMAAFLKRHPAVKQDMIDRAVQKLVERFIDDGTDHEAVVAWKKTNLGKVEKETQRIEMLIRNADLSFKTSYLMAFNEKPIDVAKLH